jgi:excinuclease ABC subunit B
LHGEQDTIERIQKLYDYRQGVIDIIVGVNLLREGIDVPECSLICIFEADSEGFLRTGDSLVQMIGRAARNSMGRVVLYADKMTNSMQVALNETARRRAAQIEYNKEHNIEPKTIIKPVNKAMAKFLRNDTKIKKEWLSLEEKARNKLIKELTKKMAECVEKMDFEEAAKIRDQRKALMELHLDGVAV